MPIKHHIRSSFFKLMVSALWIWFSAASTLGCSTSNNSDTDDDGSDADADSDSDGDGDADADADTDSYTDGECEVDANTCGDGGIDLDGSIDGFCGAYDCEIYSGDGGYDFDHEGAPHLGDTDSPQIIVTEYSYFHCSHCQNAAHMVEDLHSNPAYSDAVVFYFAHYPIPPLYNIHYAAHAAHLQGHFWEVHDFFFSDEFVALTDAETDDDEEIHAFIEDLGILDMEQYFTDFSAQSTYDYIDADADELLETTKPGEFPGTPSIFVNGHPVYPWINLPNVLDYLLGYI